MRWIATCPHETVALLSAELSALGIPAQKQLHRGIIFETDLETAYRAHLLLRTASRIQRVVGEFTISTLVELQNTLKTVLWPEFLRSHKPFLVEPALTDPQALALGQEAVINSVVQSVQGGAFEKGAPRYDPASDKSISIIVFIRNGSCVIGIDSAGRALHKRGWRVNGHPAVLKETLAASLLLLAGYDGRDVLLDPLCGSGTIAIEAAYIALNKAPLIHRGKDDFALEHLAGFDRALWRRVSDQLRAAKKSSLPAPIYAADINEKYVEIARKSALRARVEKYLQFAARPFQEWQAPAPQGLLIANLPYGERIKPAAIETLYRDVGKTIHQRFSGWRYALLVPQEAPIHLFGLPEEKYVHLMNGALPVRLLIGQNNKN